MLIALASLLLALSIALTPWQPQAPTPTLVVGSGIGPPGGTVSVPVRLDTAGIAARSYQVNLAYDGSTFPQGLALRAGGTPDSWSFHQHSSGPGDLRALAFSFNPADFQPLVAGCNNGRCQSTYVAQLSIAPDAVACQSYPVTVALLDVRDASNQLIPMSMTHGAVWVTAPNGGC